MIDEMQRHGPQYTTPQLQSLAMTRLAIAIVGLCAAVGCAPPQGRGRPATSLVISYLLVLIICGGVLVPAAIMLAGQGGTGAKVLHYGRSIW